MSPLDTLLPASFRGMEFHVASDKDSTERVVESRTFPRRDGARLDDHGLDGRKLDVEAVVSAFYTSFAAAEAFRAAMLAPGFGILTLPNALVPNAICTKCERSFKYEALGEIAFHLSFLVDDEAALSPSLAALGGAMGFAAAAMMGGVPSLLAALGAGGYVNAGITQGLGVAAKAVQGVMPALTIIPTIPALTSVANGLTTTGVAASQTALAARAITAIRAA